MFHRKFLCVLIALMVIVPGCNVVGNVGVKPVVIITSPPSGSTFLAGDVVTIQSSSADANGIARVELAVDGAIVSTDTPPSPQTTFTLIQMWTAQPGAHVINVQAYNTSGIPSNPAAISVSVSAASTVPASSSSSASSIAPSATPTLPSSSSSSSVASSSSSASASSSASVAAKPDLFVSEYTLTPNPPTQGSNVHVRIGVNNQGSAAVSTPFTVEWYAGSNYATPACSWPVASLAAKGGRILECDKTDAWASWYANITTRVKVDSGNTVSESDEGNNTKDLGIAVLQAVVAKPDLYVSEFTLTPNPPLHMANVHVRIGVYNQGNAAVTTPFTVEWYAGSGYASPACTWSVASLVAKGGQILQCDKTNAWASNYSNITTRVKVDPANAINESDEGNNIYDVAIKVN